MWAIAIRWMLVGAATLAGSAVARMMTRFVMFYFISYYGDVLSGQNNTAALLDMLLHPNDRVQEMGTLAFGQSGIVSWGNFIAWATDVWTPLRYFITAVVSWWLVKQWVSVAPSKK